MAASSIVHRHHLHSRTSSMLVSQLASTMASPLPPLLSLCRHFSKERAKKSTFRPHEKVRPFHREILDGSPDTLMQAEMYTPEVLRSESLTRNCYRVVAYGLAVPELMDRYGARAAEIAGSLKPDQFSVILNAFARASHRHDEMLKSFTRRIPPRLPQFLPMDICQTCNAYSKFRERDEALFRRFSSEMPHKLPLFEGFQLTKVANAYARLDIKDELLFDDIADEIIRRPQELDYVGLLLAANAYAHFRMPHPRLWLVLGDWILESYLDYSAANLAIILNAFSTVRFHHDGVLRTFVRGLTTEPLMHELEPGNVGLVLNALARLQWYEDRQALRILGECALDCLEDLSPSQLTQFLHACSQHRTFGANAELVDGLIERAHAAVPDFSAQSLSLLVHACAKLQKRDVQLLTKVAKAVTPRIADFTPQALAMTTLGFSRLEVRSEILFYLLAAEIVERMALFSGQGLGMVLNAYGRLQIKNERLVQACKRHARTLADELSAAEVDSIEAGFRSLDELDGTTEALLRKQRQHLGATQSTASMRDDPWAFEEDDLLRRVSDERQFGVQQGFESKTHTDATVSQVRPPQDNGTSRSSDLAAGKTPEPDATYSDSSMGSPAADKTMDLWDMWEQSSSAGDTARVESDDATPSGRLREYLARPERIGRRPVALDESQHEPISPSAATEFSDGVEETGGRRSGRKSRQQ